MEKKIKYIHIIINPAAGRDESILPVINNVMKEAGIKWEGLITHQAGDGIKFAKAAVKAGVDAVAVYGGDGTVTEAVSGLMGSETPLAILPGGSTNGLATELGIPLTVKEALTLLGQGPLETKTIDVGQFEKRYFISGISIGFEADMVKGANRGTKNKFGILAYFISGFKALKKITRVLYHIKIDGQEHDVQGLTCMITNTGNIGFSTISFDKHINVSDGLLDVLVVRKATISLFEHMLVTLIKRERPENWELVKHWQGKEISITATPAQTVQCDGEVLKEMPVNIKIIPGAIKVLVPKLPKT